MTAARYVPRSLPALAVGLALGLSSCSQEPETASTEDDRPASAAPDGDVEAFCAAASRLDDGTLFGDLGAGSGDVAGAYTTALANLDAIEPPSEIADDWATLTDAVHVMFEGIAEADPESEETVDAILELAASLDMDAVDAASAELETYLADHCDTAG